MINIVRNQMHDNHFDILNRIITEANEILIAVAFLKDTGYNQIKLALENALQNGAQIKIIAGGNFGLTEPKALQNLRGLFVNTNSEIRLAKYTRDANVFHPKMYLVRFKDSCKLLIGSANITSGGFEKNIETSVYCECTSQEDDIWVSSKNYFNILFNESNTLTDGLLAEYEEYYNKCKKANRANTQSPFVRLQSKYVTDNLERYYDGYMIDRGYEYQAARKRHYAQARLILDYFADNPNITGIDFENHITQLVRLGNRDGLWYSYGLQIKARGIHFLGYYPQYVQLINTVRNNLNTPIDILFDQCKAIAMPDGGIGINGVSINHLTEILITYNPERCVILNNKIKHAICSIGKSDIKKTIQDYTGEKYKIACDLFGDIKMKFHLENMLEVDSFLYYIADHSE